MTDKFSYMNGVPYASYTAKMTLYLDHAMSVQSIFLLLH